MANKKEPPFFNKDNMGPFHYKLPFYETMELFIETLTGTCFELRVSPFETVISVKAKIQRLEGIPVSQQHLIWNNMELKDDYCLDDYNISEGCTLKLVLAMRGGPVNTRRVPVKDPIREMAEYMDPARDKVWEKGPSNKQVTFLVYREGDRLNFFRVVDRGDGTLTPLSESLSGGSVYNLYADDEDETEASPSGQQIIENSITMNKMKLLKAKMENMNLSKKPKKTVKVKPRPPMTPRPSSGSVAAARHRFLRVLPHIGQACLPPPGHLHQPESPQNALSALATLATAGRTMPATANHFLKEDDTWQSSSWSQPVNSIRLPPKISRVELENAKLPTNSILAPVSSLPANSEKAPENPTSASEEDAVLFPNLTNVELYGKEEHLPEPDGYAFLTEGSTAEQCSEIYDIGKVNPELELPDGDKDSKVVEQHSKPLGKVLSTAAMETGLLSTRELGPQKNLLLSPLRYSAQVAHHSALKPQAQPRCFEAGNVRSAASPNVLRSLEVRSIADSSFPRTTRFCSVKVESLGKRPDVISKAETRDITDVASKTPKEPVSSVSNLGFLASLARSTNRESLQSSCGTDGFRTSGIALPASLQHFQEESFRKTAPPNEAAEYILSAHGLGMNGSMAAVGKRVAGEATHLPPVNGLIQAKKKISKHCFLCGKKTGLATSYECRCGNNFCATHRYAETHTCTYDYKSAGRRYLQETNPIISAPKLPKI
uniref:Zinc finger AN1-type containing 4 n=1 Tax=Junco hyemalis TaxID=40217 RepID=A0A8C5JWC0_JUNHY